MIGYHKEMIEKLLSEYGLKDTWLSLLYNLYGDERIEHNGRITVNLLKNLSYFEIADLYEYSLSFVNKEDKKERGQYYTPRDICELMARQAERFPDGVWCDPCCGVGNLSYELLRLKPELFESMQFFDLDEVALTLCMWLLSKLCGIDVELVKDNFHNKSFLDDKDDFYDYVLMNPPYDGSSEIAFMRKAAESLGFVAITPQSFTNSLSKDCVSLKEKLNADFSYLKIYCFDNIPGTIFNGEKKGVFNTNMSNSVRAAITVCHNHQEGHFITPLMRWRSSQRDEMLRSVGSFLEKSDRIFQNGKFLKLYKNSDRYLDYGDTTISEVLSKAPTEYALYVPTTPRYFLTASRRKLRRSGCHTLYFPSAETMSKAYIILNSSYAYWWWRIADGGMTLSRETLETMRVDSSMSLSQSIISKLIEEETICLTTKNNAGIICENVKHSERLTKEIDEFVGCQDLYYTRSNTYIGEQNEQVQL